MSTKTKLLIPLVIIFGLFVALRIFPRIDSEFEVKWKSIELGSSKAQVLKKLGAPFKESDKFSFWEMEPHETESRALGSVYYLTWIDGIDTVFVLGLNKKGSVVFKVYGGS